MEARLVSGTWGTTVLVWLPPHQLLQRHAKKGVGPRPCGKPYFACCPLPSPRPLQPLPILPPIQDFEALWMAHVVSLTQSNVMIMRLFPSLITSPPNTPSTAVPCGSRGSTQNAPWHHANIFWMSIDCENDLPLGCGLHKELLTERHSCDLLCYMRAKAAA